MESDDETAMSEITILPDGRVFVLGASLQVLEILEVLSPEDAALKERLKHAVEADISSQRQKQEPPNAQVGTSHDPTSPWYNRCGGDP